MHRHEDGGVVVEKNLKSQRIFNKNYCNLLFAITHTKILVAYFIISDKKLKYKWHITAARPTHYFVGIIFLCFGRPFVRRFALCYQTVVCLSVMLVYCGQMVRRLKNKLGVEVSLGPATLF